MQFEISDLTAIGEALEGIVEKMREQFEVVKFDLTLEYPGLNSDVVLEVRLVSIDDQPWRYKVDINEKKTAVVEQQRDDPTNPDIGVKL